MLSAKEIIKGLDTVRTVSPLVHNITNYVVMNNTANALLAIGASPVMAHAVEEVADMVNIASALVINMGTLSEKWVQSMIKAGEQAQERGIPVVFDPVGVGATAYRTQTAATIISRCKPSLIRGNASEIMAISMKNIKTKGVDSTMDENAALDAAKFLARETNSIVVISGETDFITDGQQVIAIKNGSALMPRVTGMGCTSTALIGAFAALEENPLEAAAMAMAVMGIAGELATEKAKGPGTLQLHLLDELYNLSYDTINSHLKLSYE